MDAIADRLPFSRRPRARRRATARVAHPRLRLYLLLGLLATACLLAGAWFLVRGSSLVAVERVKVVGLSGHYDKEARRAVVAAAQSMTTMQFDQDRIEQAAAEFVDVSGIETTVDFPHGVTISVDVRRPVVLARVGGRTVTLSQNGEVMNPSHAVPGLVKIDVPGSVRGDRVVSARANQAVGVLGSAPDVLLRKVESVHWGKLGIVLSLKNGPDLYFGNQRHAARKWSDAVAVLADDSSRGAAYLDLRVPGRVAVGGLGGAPLPESQTQGAAASAAAVSTPAATATPEQPAVSPTPAPAPQQTTPAPAPVQQPQQTQQAPAAAGGAAPGQ